MIKKFRYRNEAEFSKAVCSTLRKAGWFVQRIESGETGKGIPDIYAITPTGVSVWLELKREHCEIGNVPYPVCIHWRPGQQSWLHEIVMRKQHAFTLACFDDVILQIPHYKVHKDNKVLPEQCVCLKSLQELVK